MNLLERRYTRWINWGLDNLLPAVLRDSEIFMFPLLYLAFRRHWRSFVHFKAKAPYLTAPEISEIYAHLQDAHISRATDLHPKCVQRILQDIRGDSVLDVGSGRGFLTNLLKEKTNKTIFSCDLIKPASSSSHPNFLVASAQQLPFADNSIDTVICAHTLEHLINPVMAVKELRRIARQQLILVVPRQRYYQITFDLHLHFFPSADTLQLFMSPTNGTTDLLGGDLYFLETFS